MKISKNIIIIGGGESIKSGIELNLWNKLQNKFTIGCNFCYQYFKPTVISFVDEGFYNGKLLGNDKPYIDFQHLEKIKSLPLLIGVNTENNQKIKYTNTILLRDSSYYRGKESLQKGIYSKFLSGLWSITLAMILLNFKGNIYLLGFDWTQRTESEIISNKPTITHFYNDIVHKGTGKTEAYEKYKANAKFLPFLSEKNIKILNVVGHPLSNITCFDQIDYNMFFNQIIDEQLNQDELRYYIRRTLCIK